MTWDHFISQQLIVQRILLCMGRGGSLSRASFWISKRLMFDEFLQNHWCVPANMTDPCGHIVYNQDYSVVKLSAGISEWKLSTNHVSTLIQGSYHHQQRILVHLSPFEILFLPLTSSVLILSPPFKNLTWKIIPWDSIYVIKFLTSIFLLLITFV